MRRTSGNLLSFGTFLPFSLFVSDPVFWCFVMCSLMNRVKPVQRALAISLRIRTNTEGSKYATAENRHFSSGVSACTGPLRATRRSYCSRMVLPQGLFFRQVGLHCSLSLSVCVCVLYMNNSSRVLADTDWYD